MIVYYLLPRLFCLLVIQGLFYSCVSSKKYNELGRRMNFSEEQRLKCESSLRTTTTTLDSIAAVHEQASRELSQATLALSDSKKQYQLLSRDYQTLQDNVIAESEKSRKEQQKRAAELAAKDALLLKLNQQVAALQAQARQTERQHSAATTRLDSLTSQLQQNLYSFVGSELQVAQKGHRLVLAFAENLLFKPESEQLDENGSVVLASFVKTVAGQKGMKVGIESYMNNRALLQNTDCMKDSWDLALLRAASVARFLSAEGLPVSTLTPVARIDTGSEVQPSKTSRLEIIITLL